MLRKADKTLQMGSLRSRSRRAARLVLAFHRSAEHAQEALTEVRKRHFNRSAAVYRTENGRLHFYFTAPAVRIRLGLALLLAWALFLGSWIFGANVYAGASLGSIGFLLAWFGIPWLGYGLPKTVLLKYARYVLPGESLVIVSQQEKRTRDVLTALRRVGHASIFVFRRSTKFVSRSDVTESGETASLTQIPDYAKALAERHELDSGRRMRSLLPLLQDCERGIEVARRDLVEATRLDYSISSAAQWLLDNAYLIRSHIAEIRHNLPDNHNKILPVHVEAPSARFRVESLAEELVQLTSCRLDSNIVSTFLDAYQTKSPLNIAELWVFPLMLRLVLLQKLRRLSELTSERQHQKELADFWTDRFLNAANRSSEFLDRMISELNWEMANVDTHFLARLGEQLREQESILSPIHNWIQDKTGTGLAEIILREHALEANDLILTSSIIGSLRQLSEMEYTKIVESVSRLEATLREDPSGVHERSDFATRDRSRRMVEEVARQSKFAELKVAREAVDLARQAAPKSCESCVSYHLLDAGLMNLESRLKRRVPLFQRILRFLYRFPTQVYLGSLATLTAGLLLLFLLIARKLGVDSLPALLLVGLLALVPTSEMAVQLLQVLLTWVLPPRVLPKMSFEGGIPVECRTLVVVPMMLLTEDSIRGEVEKLEVRYLSNPEANLLFSLLADFTDAEEPEMPEDDALLGVAVKGIEELNTRYGDGVFTLYHRPRTWCQSESRWIGWERKRGKLEELNQLLNQEKSTLSAAAGLIPKGVRYVITLDADTQLPHGTARRMIETIAHPLNRVELGSDGRSRIRGYTVIQPRVSITLPSATASRFTRLFTDARGMDPYCHAVSDLYQDLFGEGIYHGKAIYDVQAFHKILGKRFPEQRLLSHDLIEGAHVGVGLASDVELFEHFPYDYVSYSKREHRWIRGDWQIASWILSRVPDAQQNRVRNTLTFINRWKIADNLRRSLLAPTSLLFLVLSWALNLVPLASSLLISLALVAPLTFQLLKRLAQRLRGDLQALRGVGTDINRAMVMATFLPHQSYLSLDAIGRACYRTCISKRRLLEWQTGDLPELAIRSHLDLFRAQFFLISLFATISLILLNLRDRFGEPAYFPFLILWVAAPAMLFWIGRQPRGERKQWQIDSEDRLYLRRIARDTWRFFDDLVAPEHNWLPPDNSQVALRIETAARTSPTNIGMWLTSALSAFDLGFLTVEQLIDRCSATIDTLTRLERCEGHLLNWYNTKTLDPLEPKYVSTVDSGNLIASLWVLAQGAQEFEERSQLENSALRGLADTLAIISERIQLDHTIAVPIRTLRELLQTDSTGTEIMIRIRLAADPARKLKASLQWSTSDTDERVYWINKLDQQIQEWVRFFDKYLQWATVLLAPPDEFLLPLGQKAIEARRTLLRHLPSWKELANSNDDVLPYILDIGITREGLSPKLIGWMSNLEAEYEKAKTLARELLQRTQHLKEKCNDLAGAMDMEFLYDADRRLFSIGYLVGGPRTFSSHYDLLASEARLSSLVAIAKGDVPVNHWLALGRPYTSSNGQVLLSWSGTMFEYLMPLLFTKSFRNSLLTNACGEAVQRQIDYGNERSVPWGVSESAYSAIDSHKIYQYQAFGVPSLALKRLGEDDLVVAPYATALALLVAPTRSIKNLKRLERAGMYGAMGFYDALDYTRRDQGQDAEIIYTYMAHHQGMSLTAINNALTGRIMQRRFHSDPRIKAVEPLLFERIPQQPSMLQHSPAEQTGLHMVSDTVAPAYRVLDDDTLIPRCHLLGNEQYSLMITNAGGGYSRWRGFDIARWRSDTTRDNWGMFFYVQEDETKFIWSLTHQPLNQKDPRYTATFTPDRIEFRRRRLGVESHLEVCVSPEDDAEIRRITFVNHGLRERKLELTSAVELSLAPHNEDRAHAAFNKLFIQTEAISELHALIAWRRPRSEDDEPVWVAQFIVENPSDNIPFEYETDRARLLGRGRSWSDPKLSVEQTTGYVLDPVFSLRRRFSLDPRERVQITFVTLAAESREKLLRLITKYRDENVCSRAFELARSRAQLDFRYLGIEAEAAFRFGELVSHLIYPNMRLRAAAERLRRNALGQSRLWAYGISGDLPILVVSITDIRGLALVRELLIAHTYWRLHGFKADLMILNREPASYEQPLHQELRRLVEAHSLHTGTDRPGGVFLRKENQIPQDDLDLILTAAQVTLSTVRGSLSKQLSSPAGTPLPSRLQVKRSDEQPSTPLPFLELPYFNGLGGFTPDGREYATYLGPRSTTPTPWINVIANPVFGTQLSESGSGCSWYANSQSNRLTPWSNDPVSDSSSDTIYIRDDESGVFWTPTALPIRELDAYRARHGQGYTEFEHNSHALEQTLLTFVPITAGGHDPVRIQRLRIKNRSSRSRRLSVTSYVEPVLGVDREVTEMFVVTTWDQNSKALFMCNSYHPDYGRRIAFLAMVPDPVSFTADRTEFLGRYGSTAAPEALRREGLSKRTGQAFDPCAALQTKLDLGPGEEKAVIVILGQAKDTDEAQRLIERYRNHGTVARAIAETREWWDSLLTTIQVKTPILAVDLLINRWLLYQTLSCRIWGRSAMYQSSGAFGFRDQLQDSLTLVYSAPGITKQIILQAAGRQFIEGDVQHWWHLPSGAGLRSRCSDDLLWLPYVACQYIEVTGDLAIMDTQIAFLEGRGLKGDELEAYFVPALSSEQASLFEHCRRSIERGTTTGPHGLPLIGTGDWNDGLNRVGDKGTGESVWLGWFLVDVYNKFADVCDHRGENELAHDYRDRASRLSKVIEETSWDGEWYRRGYFDEGLPLGSRANDEAQIDSLPQSWSIISGAGNPDRANKAMLSVEEYLVRKKEKIVLLFTPAFDQSQPHPGYIMGYPPGVRENGGQYTHAALWVAMAFARMGKGDLAVEVLQILNPVEHGRNLNDCLLYKTEPYAVAADVYSLEGQRGRGGWSWYTGSAGWMYRVWIEEILGFKLRGNELTIKPAIPADWPGYSITFRKGKTEYRIEVENGNEAPENAAVHLQDDGGKHTIRIGLARSDSTILIPQTRGR